MALILGFSGSPIPNSNLDFVIREILQATGHKTEFIKISHHNIRPCLGCFKCVSTNRCVQDDEMNKFLEKIIEAQGIVIGGFPTFFSLNALTKTFLERWYPLKHRRMLTHGKYGVTVAGGFRDAAKVKEYINSFFKWYQMDLVGDIQISGNAPCLFCGYGEDCLYSNVPLFYGSNRIRPEMFFQAKEDKDLLEKARSLGRKLGEKVLIKA
ncbi:MULTISPECIES: flavodoxin family protein [unclassified Carboxydocella]|uniref:flavodoxin family protein n=1 Tax=unclassified Carboxydocella TaxID=2685367 RepID=UPI0009AD8955|nr:MULTISPECIES: flavodoxin family protein [unclassified Carboxydocella]GAW28038.1 hypothetical protein ULO1_06080 [Carboxydocella sp. ULO1]GAW31701.1 hypothetical protein JDF658_14660 [Carboxydocella sp. JDF658]